MSQQASEPHGSTVSSTESSTGDATPVRTDTTRASSVPAVPVREPWPTPPPARFSTSFGWTLVAVGTALLAFASWDLYPNTAAGMWAGYRDLVAILVIGYSLCLLRCDLPRMPFIGACLLMGVLVVLEGIFLSSGLRIMIPQIACGAVIAVGAALMASSADR